MPDAYKGAQDPDSASSDYNVADFHIRQILSQLEHATLVRVANVANVGDLAPVGLVDVVPLIQQQDGYGTLVAGNTVYDVPYFRLQGGTRAVIIDPSVGDIGIAVIADRDISPVIATKDAALPGSQRRNSIADALYIGGVLNGAPTSVIRMKGNDVHVECPGNFTVDAGGTCTINASGGSAINSPTIALNGAITQGAGSYGGSATFSGPSITHNGKNIGATHTHSGVQTGGGNTGAPN